MASRTSFAMGLLNPNAVSAQRLSPGSYSLSARSNIPFIRVIGKGFDKTFTWGETIEIPTGAIGTVSNASFHAGDVYINSGCDLNNKPARITVPVPYTLNVASGLWTPGYPADVRAARRAYICFDAITLAQTASRVVGIRIDGSHNTKDEIQPSGLGYTGSGYLHQFNLPAASDVGMIPLGHLAAPSNDGRPHTLLTTAYFEITAATISVTFAGNPNAYYTMEY